LDPLLYTSDLEESNTEAFDSNLPTNSLKVLQTHHLVYSSDSGLSSTDARDSKISEQSDNETVTVLDYLQMLCTLVCMQ